MNFLYSVSYASALLLSFIREARALSKGAFGNSHGRRTEAHEHLAPIYGWFTEGFGTPYLKDAAALLRALP